MNSLQIKVKKNTRMPHPHSLLVLSQCSDLDSVIQLEEDGAGGGEVPVTLLDRLLLPVQRPLIVVSAEQGKKVGNKYMTSTDCFLLRFAGQL